MADHELRIEPLSDAELDSLTARLRSGGADGDDPARRVLIDFILRHWLGKPHSAVTLEWLADAFDAILQGAKPLDALGLRPRPAQRPKGKTDVSTLVAVWLRLAEDRGYTHAEAVALAAGRFARDTKSIERYRRAAAKWNWADSLDPEIWEQVLLAAGKPLPRHRNTK